MRDGESRAPLNDSIRRVRRRTSESTSPLSQRVAWMHLLAKELIVFGMASYPKPKQPFWNFNCERAIMKTHPDRPVLANPLEMQ